MNQAALSAFPYWQNHSRNRLLAQEGGCSARRKMQRQAREGACFMKERGFAKTSITLGSESPPQCMETVSQLKVCPGTTHMTKLCLAQLEAMVQPEAFSNGKRNCIQKSMATRLSLSTQSPARGSRTLTLDTHVWITAATLCQCCVL